MIIVRCGRQLAAVDTVLVVDFRCALHLAIDLSPGKATKRPRSVDTRISCTKFLNGRSETVAARLNRLLIEVTGLLFADVGWILRSSRPPMLCIQT